MAAEPQGDAQRAQHDQQASGRFNNESLYSVSLALHNMCMSDLDASSNRGGSDQWLLSRSLSMYLFNAWSIGMGHDAMGPCWSMRHAVVRLKSTPFMQRLCGASEEAWGPRGGGREEGLVGRAL